ncbi:MAG: hypothetical protein C3F11_17385 [Methylocystaceae bacterium]|nr:MAG: hypothetical protein C3F11_17385 [Methylocystaceae bacterium]
MNNSVLKLTLAAILMTPSVLAAQRFIVLSSDTDKFLVEAYGERDWCSSPIRFRMVLRPGSPLAGSAAAQIAVMNRLKKRILHDCPAATRAVTTVAGPGAAAGVFAAGAAEGWAFAPAGQSLLPQAQSRLPPKDSFENPAPSAAPATPVATQSPAPSAPEGTVPPAPRDLNYASAFLAYVQADPAMMRDAGVLRWWASYRYRDDYYQARNQEFRLQPLLERAGRDLAETMKRNDGRLVTIVLRTDFEPYDFQSRRFPVKLRGQQITVNNNDYSVQGAPGSFTIETQDLELIDGLPMERDAAESFAENRTKWGVMNRTIFVATTIRLDGQGFSKNGYAKDLKAAGSLERAVFYNDERATQPFYSLAAPEIEKARKIRAARIEAEKKAEELRIEAEKKAEAARLAEKRRQELQAERESTIRLLAASPVSVRLANWISNWPVDAGARLDDLRSARASALIGGAPVTVKMLIQADSGGRERAKTKWPGHLEIDVPAAQPELRSSGWYLVRGELSAPDANALSAAKLSVVDLYACAKPQCADAADAQAIVDRKLAGAQGR